MAAEAARGCCAHCGLPVAVRASGGEIPVYCCHACRLAAAIVGGGAEGEKNWKVLRLGLGALLSMNVMMVSLLFYAGSVEPGQLDFFRKVLLALSTAALLILLPPFLAPVPAGRERYLESLIAGGSLAAYGVSAVNTVAGGGEVYFDTATMLPVLVTLGRLLEGSAKSGAAELLRSLERLLPERALRVGERGSEEVPLDRLAPGDLVRLRPGERIAVDGVIVEGCTTVEEASFTGEYLPRSCRTGDQVVAGAVNGAGSVLVRAQRTGSDLLLQGIVAQVREAWRTPSQAERLSERAAGVFLFLVVITAASAFVFWALRGEISRGLLSALSVSVVACPCTMGIATPLATALAIARAAKEGVVVRGGRAMERVAATSLVVFDKTGTVTEGRPVLTRLMPADPGGEEPLLGRLAVLESASGHPLARAVLAAADARSLPAGSVSDVALLPEGGLEGTVFWGEVRVRVSARPGGSAAGGETAVEVNCDGVFAGTAYFRDAVRHEACCCIERLKEMRVASALLSGDAEPAAREVAARIGVERVEAPRTPSQKLAVIAAHRKGTGVAMVGDGVNDAPALAAAETGIAIGAGTDLARQAGNVVILSNRLSLVPWLIALGKETNGIIRGNFLWSFGYNLVALAAAAAGILHPLLAALAMVFSSLTVLGNSLRVTRFPGVAPERP